MRKLSSESLSYMSKVIQRPSNRIGIQTLGCLNSILFPLYHATSEYYSVLVCTSKINRMAEKLCFWIEIFHRARKKESKILRKLLHAFLAWVRSWIFMFKLVSETQEWFLGNLLGKSCSFPLLLECAWVSQRKWTSKMNPCESRLLWGKNKPCHGGLSFYDLRDT